MSLITEKCISKREVNTAMSNTIKHILSICYSQIQQIAYLDFHLNFQDVTIYDNLEFTFMYSFLCGSAHVYMCLFVPV